MKILFWNTKRNKKINKYIVSLVLDYDIDIFIMAEYHADILEFRRIAQKIPFKTFCLLH